ncbi:MAG: nucleoside triphosphate pyrophosphohydrolase [Sporichthyaceae bacterium]
MSAGDGAALLALVAVMDRLRSPGGCPWDAEQTHESLLTYVLEETYELVEAVETGDRAHLREELGDLLLQVIFHARVAAEHPQDPFDIDDVAEGIRAKLVRRHPHVFAAQTAVPGQMPDVASVEATWETIKAAEKGRTSAMDGVPLAQPALALASKLQSRAERAGVAVPLVAVGDDIGDALFALVAAARARGVDPEAALRETCRRFAADVRASAS